MPTNPPRSLHTVLLAVFLLIFTAGVASGQSNAFAEYDSVSYYFAHGAFNSSTMMSYGGDTGALTINATVCVKAQLRPEIGRGRINVIGLLNGRTLIEMNLDEFLTPDGTIPAITPNITVDQALAQDPPLRAYMAAWAAANVTVANRDYFDPVNGDANSVLEGAFYVTRDGERDDVTKEHLTIAERGDDEMHLRIWSPPGSPQVSASRRIAPPGDLPDGSFSPNEAYGGLFTFYNSRFGGTATVHIAGQANAPAGYNELTFTFSSPTGVSLAEATIRPAALAPSGVDVTFPLDEFGDYVVEVRGKVALAKYQVNVVMSPPKALDLDIWWEDVVVGDAANRGMADCRKEMGYATVADIVVNRPKPPSWFMEMVIVGIVGSTAGVLLLIKIVSDGVASLQLKKRFGG